MEAVEQKIDESKERLGLPFSVPNPVPAVAEGVRSGISAITGGGITKDEATGMDEKFVSSDGQVKSTGEAAQQSMEQQTQSLSMDEFRERIRSGQIPTVAKIPEGVLQTSLKLLDMDSVSIENKRRANERLDTAYKLYNMQQQKPGTVIAFGQQVGEGEFVFAPTESAKRDPKELSAQQNVFEGKKAIAQVVNGAFGEKLGLSEDDQKIIENIFVRNISTGSFWDNLVEKLDEGIIRGSVIYAPDLILNYGVHAAQAAAAAATSFLNPFVDTRGFMQQWEDTAEQRTAASNWWKNFLKDNVGVKQLSVVMNEMVVTDLQRQLDAKEINEATFKRLTESKITTPSGEQVDVKNQFINEDIAQTLLNESIDKLSGSAQYGLVLTEAFTMMLGVGKAKQAIGNKEVKTITDRVSELARKAELPDASEADIQRAAKYAKMTPFQAGRAFILEGDIDKFNEKAVLYAMGMDRVQGNMKRIVNERNDLSKRMAEFRTAGGNLKSAEYRAMEAEKQRLVGMTVKTYLTGRFIPNVKENFIEAAPLSAAMYFGGDFEPLRGFFEGDRLAAEGISALGYMLVGRGAVSGLGKGAYWINQQGGDLVNKSLTMVEAVGEVGRLIPFVGRNVLKGYLKDNSIKEFNKAYVAATGNDLSREARVALNVVGKVAGALDDDGLEQVVSSMEKHKERLSSLVNAFPPNEREEIRKLLQESLAVTSNIGWLQSANKLAGFKVDARSIGSEKSIKEQIEAQRLIAQQSARTRRLVDQLRAKIANRTDLEDPGEMNRYLDSLEAGIRQNDKQLGTDRALLTKQITDFRKAILSNPETELPPSVIESLDDIEFELQLTINPDMDQLALINKQFAENKQALAVRAENIALLRNNEVAHTKQTARSLEMMVTNKFTRMRKRAKRGFIQLDKTARETGKTIDISKMITELMSFAPEADQDLGRFFSKNSRFFVGTLGKRMYTVANRMAVRSLEGLEGSGYDDLYRLATNPDGKLADGTSTFLGDNPRPLDIMLFYMERGEAPPFLSTPGEVMDVYSAFRDYAIRTGDDALASRYLDYSDSVADTVKEQAPKLFQEWKKARQIYQMEWFDKLRMDGPLGKLQKSQNGPVSVVGKMDEPGESFFFDDLAIGEQVPEEMITDRMFRIAYKGVDPLSAFDGIPKNLNKAFAGDDDAVTELIRVVGKIKSDFSENPIGEAFDLTNKDNLADFNLLSAHLTELVYAKWGRGVAKQLGERSDLDIDAIKGGGYNFDKIDNVAQVQEIMTVNVKGADGVNRKVKLVDFDKMIAEERGIEKLVRESNEMAANMDKYRTRVVSDLDASLIKITSDMGVRDEAVSAITKASGTDSPRAFFEKYVVNGTIDGIDRVRNSVRAKLGDSFTVDGKVYGTEEALDRGITYMIVNGMLDHGGLAPVVGKKSIGSNGKEYTTQAMYNPERIGDALERENVQQILAQYIDSDHQNYLSEMADYLSDNAAVEASALEAVPKIENVIRPMNVNQLISRGFNLARGMVSPQYVAAELGVSLATQAGLDMMKLAAGNKEAADLMLQLMKFPKQMTEADLDTFDNLVTSFVVTELGQLGEAGREIMIDITTPPEGDKD